MHNVTVNSDLLADSNSVRFSKQAMSHQEVIRNTAAMLRDYETANGATGPEETVTPPESGDTLRYFKKTDAQGKLLWVAQAYSIADEAAAEITEGEYDDLTAISVEDDE